MHLCALMEADRTGGEILEAHWAASIAKLMSPRRRAMKEGTEVDLRPLSMYSQHEDVHTHTHMHTYPLYIHIHTEQRHMVHLCQVW